MFKNRKTDTHVGGEFFARTEVKFVSKHFLYQCNDIVWKHKHFALSCQRNLFYRLKSKINCVVQYIALHLQTSNKFKKADVIRMESLVLLNQIQELVILDFIHMICCFYLVVFIALKIHIMVIWVIWQLLVWSVHSNIVEECTALFAATLNTVWIFRWW